MVFYKGQKPPKALTWKQAEKIITALGAKYISTEGDHKKFHRPTDKGTLIIILPKYTEISGRLLDSIIHQTGIPKKQFWKAFFQQGKAVKISASPATVKEKSH